MKLGRWIASSTSAWNGDGFRVFVLSMMFFSMNLFMFLEILRTLERF